MHISQTQKRAWQFQFLGIALSIAVLNGLRLLIGGGRLTALYWIALLFCLFLLPSSWLQNALSVLKGWWALDRKQTYRLSFISFAATLTFSLAAYGFLFTNEFFSHDSLTRIYYNTSNTFNFYVQVGRVLLPLYEMLKGPASAPWLIGFLFILWLSLTAALTARLFQIQSTTGIILTSGLLCTNAALSLTGATYIYCMDEYGLALLTAVAAAWCICRCRYGEILGVFLIAVSLNLYQSYFTVTAIFCFLSVIQTLMKNEKTATTIRYGFRCLALLAAGFGLYFLFWTVCCSVIGAEKLRMEDTFFSEGILTFLRHILDSAYYYFSGLLDGEGVLGMLYPAVNLLLWFALLFWLAGWFRSKPFSTGNKLLLVAAACLLPFALNAGYILFPSYHDLMAYNAGLGGIVLLLCAEQPFPRAPSKRFRIVAALLVLALVWQNIVFANQAYMKKELHKAPTISTATRIIDRVEEMDGYVPGETPVAFVGVLGQNPYIAKTREGFQSFSKKTGMGGVYSPTYNFSAYILTYLNYSMNIDEWTDFASMEQVQAMPAFPLAGSVQYVGNTIVVKLS